jgi:hypothetical protein
VVPVGADWGTDNSHPLVDCCYSSLIRVDRLEDGHSELLQIVGKYIPSYSERLEFCMNSF